MIRSMFVMAALVLSSAPASAAPNCGDGELLVMSFTCICSDDVSVTLNSGRWQCVAQSTIHKACDIACERATGLVAKGYILPIDATDDPDPGVGPDDGFDDPEGDDGHEVVQSDLVTAPYCASDYTALPLDEVLDDVDWLDDGDGH